MTGLLTGQAHKFLLRFFRLIQNHRLTANFLTADTHYILVNFAKFWYAPLYIFTVVDKCIPIFSNMFHNEDDDLILQPAFSISFADSSICSAQTL